MSETTKRKTKAQISRDNKAAIAQQYHAPTIEEQTTQLGMDPQELNQPYDASVIVPQANAVGRPSGYTPEIAAELCASIATGLSLRSACTPANMPALATVYRWLAARDTAGAYVHEEFRELYSRACEDRADAMVEDIMDIADNGTNDYMEILDAEGRPTGAYRVNGDAIQRSKLRVTARMWYASKVKPKKYGNIMPDLPPTTLLQPIIYIPQELPYKAVTNQGGDIIDGQATQSPAPQSTASAAISSPTGGNVVPGTTSPHESNR